MALDSTLAYQEAIASWPMPRVLAHYGMSQFLPGSYKKEPCPYCGRKGKFSAFQKKCDGKWLVKCQIDRPTACEANKAMDEIGLIQNKDSLAAPTSHAAWSHSGGRSHNARYGGSNSATHRSHHRKSY